MSEPMQQPRHPDPAGTVSTRSLIERAAAAMARGRDAAPAGGDELATSAKVYAWQARPGAPAAEPAASPPEAGPAPVAAESAPAQAPARPRPVHAIDRQALADAAMIVPEGGASAQLEEFRIVKRRLIEHSDDLARRGAGPAARRVMITSAHAGEGKTFTATNLALAIAAEKDTDVLLVDLDLACTGVLKLLGLPDGPGLMDAIVDPRLDVGTMVMATDVPGLSVLGGGRPTNSDAEYLASARARAVLDQLGAGAPGRIIVFDTPPSLVASLPGELAKLVGQGVLVVRANRTTNSAIQDAISLLSGCPNMQLLLNAVQFSPSGRRFGSYHGYRG